jgi:hypothetical protein
MRALRPRAFEPVVPVAIQPRRGLTREAGAGLDARLFPILAPRLPQQVHRYSVVFNATEEPAHAG